MCIIAAMFYLKLCVKDNGTDGKVIELVCSSTAITYKLIDMIYRNLQNIPIRLPIRPEPAVCFLKHSNVLNKYLFSCFLRANS